MVAPLANSLELIVALTYLADHTDHVHFGSMVAPFSFRDPVFLARQAAAIDALSEGRMILGVGAGWQEAEHTMFGYDLADKPLQFLFVCFHIDHLFLYQRLNDPPGYVFYHFLSQTHGIYSHLFYNLSSLKGNIPCFFLLSIQKEIYIKRDPSPLDSCINKIIM